MNKNTKRVASLAVAAMFLGLIAGKASAAPITESYADTWLNFPGWAVDPRDQIGDPQVSSMSVTFDENTLVLDSVSIDLTNRLTWDSLFINANWNGNMATYDEWDYYVYSSHSKDELSSVNDPTNYAYTLAPSGRPGHPNAIASADLKLLYKGLQAESTAITSYDGSKLIYDLSSFDIILGDMYMIAYAPWCANDVIGTTAVPEPGTMLLFGAGLAGLIGIGRRRVRIEQS